MRRAARVLLLKLKEIPQTDGAINAGVVYNVNAWRVTRCRSLLGRQSIVSLGRGQREQTKQRGAAVFRRAAAPCGGSWCRNDGRGQTYLRAGSPRAHKESSRSSGRSTARKKHQEAKGRS